MNPLTMLRHHVSGAISRGDSVPIVEIPAIEVISPVNVDTTIVNKGNVKLIYKRKYKRRQCGACFTLMSENMPYRCLNCTAV